MQMTHHTPTPTAPAARPERFRAVPDVVTAEVLRYFSDALFVTDRQWQACAAAADYAGASALGIAQLEIQQKHELALARFVASL